MREEQKNKKKNWKKRNITTIKPHHKYENTISKTDIFAFLINAKIDGLRLDDTAENAKNMAPLLSL